MHLNSAAGLDRPSAQACCARTGWDNCPTSLTLLVWLTHKISSDTTQTVNCCKEVGYRQSGVGPLLKYLVVHLNVGHGNETAQNGLLLGSNIYTGPQKILNLSSILVGHLESTKLVILNRSSCPICCKDK